MNIISWLLIVLIILFILFYIAKTGRTREIEKKNREEMLRQSNEKVIRPERKLHEEEKKRWEDEYWKRQ